MVRLKAYDGAEKVREIELGAQLVTIGRDEGSTLVLADASVSRRHATIEAAGNFYLVRDSGSTNGTFVNEMLVRAHVLSQGDVLRVGKYLMRIDARSDKSSDSTRVRVEKLNLPGMDAARLGAGEEEDRLSDPWRERLVRLCEIQAALGPIDAPQTLLERALEAALAELQADRGSILLDRGGASREAAAEWTSRAVRSAVQGGPRATELVIPEELIASAARGQACRHEISSGERRSILVGPLKAGGRVRGAIYLERGASRPPFSAEDLCVLTAISGQTATSLANSELFAQSAADREKLEAVFTSLTDGVLVTGPDLKVVEANPASGVLLGIKDFNPLGSPLAALLKGFSLPPSEEALRAGAERGWMVFQLLGESGERQEAPAGNISAVLTRYPQQAEKPKGFVVTLRKRSESHSVDVLKLVVREAARSVEREARQRGFIVVERLREDLPPVVGRGERLKKAFQHVVDGAIGCARHGGQLLIEAQDLGGYVQVDFIDDGPGISKEQAGSVLLARHVVREEGGEVRVTSPYRNRDHGSCVSVLLPTVNASGRSAAGKSKNVRVEVDSK